jgi:hypothetical protein
MFESKVKYGKYEFTLWDFGSIKEISLSSVIDNSIL